MADLPFVLRLWAELSAARPAAYYSSACPEIHAAAAVPGVADVSPPGSG
jgi:hypothetical protein